MNKITDIVVYTPSQEHPKGLEALRSFKSYLSAIKKPYIINKIDPCSNKALFEVMLNMKERNLICGGSGLRALGVLLVVSCILSKSKCLLNINYEGGGPCLNIELDEIKFERREEALIFAYLALNNESTLEELTNVLNINKKSLWRILDGMTNKGLVRKVKRGVYTLALEKDAKI